jgi:hypothetical protein
MNEIQLNPEGKAVRRAIERAAEEQLDSPVAYAFNDGWPVELTELEAEELLEAIKKLEVKLFIPRQVEHKRIAIEEVAAALNESED